MKKEKKNQKKRKKKKGRKEQRRRSRRKKKEEKNKIGCSQEIIFRVGAIVSHPTTQSYLLRTHDHFSTARPPQKRALLPDSCRNLGVKSVGGHEALVDIGPVPADAVVSGEELTAGVSLLAEQMLGAPAVGSSKVDDDVVVIAVGLLFRFNNKEGKRKRKKEKERNRKK